jgi:hypothetical protein
MLLEECIPNKFENSHANRKAMELYAFLEFEKKFYSLKKSTPPQTPPTTPEPEIC